MLILYIVTVFVSALLMFMIQPLFANTVLPLLGGSPAVWNTATMFYQSTLLLGYVYAHVLKTYLKPRVQAIVHGLVVLLPLLVLPIGVPQGWTPPTEGTPVLWMLALLGVSVGLPFFVLSTTSSLIQAWFARSRVTGGRDPYFLYAASNIGSMLGLLAYPLVMQPVMRLQEQKSFWSAGYVLLALLLLGSILAMWRTTPDDAQNAAAAPADPPPSLMRRLRWILLAFAPSSLMSSVTIYITTDVTPVPLLWVLPLALYLLTFIVVFAKPNLFTSGPVTLAMQILLLALAMLLTSGLNEPVLPVIALHVLAFFAIALACHGQLAASRPAPGRLTEFYLFMSLGGALGGVFTALIAPAVFTNIVEYPLVLLLPMLLLVRRDQVRLPELKRDLAWAVLAGGVAAGGLIVTLRLLPESMAYLPVLLTTGMIGGLAMLLPRRRMQSALVFSAVFAAAQVFAAPWSPLRQQNSAAGSNYEVLDERRSFFGVKRVLHDRERNYTVLLHGSTMHGGQSKVPGKECVQTAYYSQRGPVGQFLSTLPRSLSHARMGVVGLGSGVLAGYGVGNPGQRWTYFEIDPDIKAVAQDDDRMFSFLNTCTPGSKVVLGDARLTLAREPEASYDVLFMDAYSSDAIPVHLITKEALAMYQTRIKPDGYLLFHISNRYFDLQPILANLAAELNMSAKVNAYKPSTDDSDVPDTPSMWVVLANDPKHLSHLSGNENWRALEPDPAKPVWTDDFSSLLGALRLDAFK